jgi:hypothetical protein
MKETRFWLGKGRSKLRKQYSEWYIACTGESMSGSSRRYSVRSNSHNKAKCETKVENNIELVWPHGSAKVKWMSRTSKLGPNLTEEQRGPGLHRAIDLMGFACLGDGIIGEGMLASNAESRALRRSLLVDGQRRRRVGCIVSR